MLRLFSFVPSLHLPASARSISLTRVVLDMPRKVTLDIAPPLARWMKDSLDRSVFYRSIPVLAVRVPPAKAGLVMKAEAMRG